MAKPSNQQKARASAHFVAAELHRRGAETAAISDSGRTFEILASGAGRTRTLRVKTKTVGDWQTSTRLGRASDPDPAESRFWILVDIGKAPGISPQYFVVPEWWILNYIHDEIEAHLASHGGTRPRTPDSTHCAIHPADVEQWRDRWEMLGILLTP